MNYDDCRRGMMDWAARLSSLFDRVLMATNLLLDGDAMRMQPEPPASKWCDRAQRVASCCRDGYSQLISLTLWVRRGGAHGRSVAAECMKMDAEMLTQYLRRRRCAAGTK